MAKAKKSVKKEKPASAEELAKLEQEAKEKAELAKPLVIPKATRALEEVIKDRVTILPGNIGLKLSNDTKVEESLQILDWTQALSDHVGFMIGDVLNFGSEKWGNKYTAALEQTGRAKSTLWGYAEAARKIPAANRVASLTFTHHREVLRLGDDEKIAAVLKEIGAQADKGNAPTTKEVRFKVQKLTPRKKKPSKKSTSGKGKKGKAKPEPPPYEPTSDEDAKLAFAEEAISGAVDAIKAGKLYHIVAKLTNKEKKRWMVLVEPIVTFYNLVDKVTGYTD
jgi:hypothetical protein